MSIELTTNGQSRHTILIGAAADLHIRTAADDLRKYVQLISRARLDIVTERDVARPVIVLGTPDTVAQVRTWTLRGLLRLNELGDEGYVISTIGSDVAIAADTSGGVMYGVYGFLEDVLGCRFFMPDEEIGEYVPRRPCIVLKELEVRCRPSLALRAVAFLGRRESTSWARKNRLNHLTCRLRAGGGEFLESPSNTTRMHPGAQFHTFSTIIPAQKHFPDHPDWFPLIDGKRSHGPGKQLCTTNPQVVDAVVTNFREAADADPSLRWFFLAPEDAHGSEYWCQCEHCRALDEPDAPLESSASRRYFSFVTAVAESFGRSHPGGRIVMGAYKDYLWPPRTADLDLPDNVVVMLCHQRPFCLLHPIEFDKRVENPDRTDARAQCVVGSGPCFNQSYRELLDLYASRRQLFVYEYYGKVGWFGLPWPLQRNLRQDLSYYRRSGVQGFYINAADNFGTNGQLYYLAAKFCWNTRIDVDAVLKDYYEHFYGPARRPMQRYFERLCDCFQDAPLCSDGYFYQYYDRRTWLINTFNEMLLTEIEGLVDEAERLADTPVIRKRVRLSRLSIEFTRVMLHLFASLNECERPGPGAAPKQARQRRARDLKTRIIQDMDSGRWGAAVAPACTYDYFFDAMDQMIDRAQ